MKSVVWLSWLLLTVAVSVSCGENHGKIELINKARESISRAVIVVSGQTLQMANVAPSQSAAATYRIKTDGDYDVDIQFSSGKRLRKRVGYVTRGFDLHHEIVVTDSDIRISDGPTNRPDKR